MEERKTRRTIPSSLLLCSSHALVLACVRLGLCSPGYPGTYYVDQVSITLKETHLLLLVSAGFGRQTSVLSCNNAA